jgi:ABC-type uncharacterized transport system ATPase subunit
LHKKSVHVIPEGELPKNCRVAGIPGNIHEGRLQFELDITKTPLKKFMAQLFQDIDVADITISDTPLEDVIHELYTKEKQ